VTEPAGPRDLIVAFPAAGAGGATLDQLEKLAARHGMAYLALANPASLDALESGQWQAQCVDRVEDAVREALAGRVILVGHCMGGLSAVRLSDGLGPRLALPVEILVINTPCPDSAGRIPTMSQFSDAEIAEVLAHDGFPRDLLDDEDVLADIAQVLRGDAAVADRVAEWIAAAGDLDTLYVLSTRGDFFVPPEHCAAWRHRVSGDLHLTITPGGHTLDEAMAAVLDRAIDAVAGRARAQAA
jgi:surfactin synthase thioesterase subunit